MCKDEVDVKGYIPITMGPLYHAAGSDEAYALYRHIMLKYCWNKPYCPVCGLEFKFNPNKTSMRMRFARHWCRYVGLTDQEHIIMSAMGEE
jgi:hypothetical protein